MFAVIKTGGKQYRVAAGDTITVEKLAGEPGQIIAFEQVLMLVNGATTEIGVPAVAGATVAGELVEQTRGAKVIAFKKRRRKNSRRKRGHRQDLTVVKITEILTGGAKPTLQARTNRPAAGPREHGVQSDEAAPDAAKAEKTSKPKIKKVEDRSHGEAEPQAPAQADQHNRAGIATNSPTALEAAKAKGIDTETFQPLEQPIGKPDDLKLISGVGPAIEKKLNAAGVWHYWQVKAFSDEDIAKVEQQAGAKGRAHRDDWRGQAADLMAGKEPRPKS
ncbi:MAG: 50S ribosomal protein L21 [Hyphomicrobiales bacterium]|nr:50S ribosomal protein L21 [Hyphomicrobiales bacterium]MBV9741467.1 50S ribosomal protein L21 [Hyphomicrobiales bacterium]